MKPFLWILGYAVSFQDFILQIKGFHKKVSAVPWGQGLRLSNRCDTLWKLGGPHLDCTVATVNTTLVMLNYGALLIIIVPKLIKEKRFASSAQNSTADQIQLLKGDSEL